jgi:N-hydroxyarylamine O-acetyltransferase
VFNLDAYLHRVGLTQRPDADAVGLSTLQRAHRLAIPFENLDIPLGRGISLDPDRVFAKLVTARRGGYCFEQNQLFARGLQQSGFETRPLLARVWLFADGVPARTHSFPLVMIDGQPWIADAGFGGGYAPPMPLVADAIVAGPDGVRHRFIIDPRHGWMLERDGGSGFLPQYSFSLDEVVESDLTMANHWTSTAPASRFVGHIIVSTVLPDGAASLQDLYYTRRTADGTTEHEITSPRMLQELLHNVFSIALSDTEIDTLWRL